MASTPVPLPSTLVPFSTPVTVRQSRLPPIPLVSSTSPSSPASFIPPPSQPSHTDDSSYFTPALLIPNSDTSSLLLPSSSSSSPLTLSIDCQFLLHLQPSIHSQLCAFSHSFLTTDHRPPPSPSSPFLSPYVPLFQSLLHSLTIQPNDTDLTCRLKTCDSIHHYQSSAIQRLTQHAQHLTARYSDLHSGRVEQPLVLHSDLSHLLHLLTEPDMQRSSLSAPVLTSEVGVQSLRACLAQLSTAVVGHCTGWLVDRLHAGFGPALSTFPLIIPTYPTPLDTLKDGESLSSSPLLKGEAGVVSPYLTLYLHWLSPLLALAPSLHPSTGVVLSSLVSSLHSALFCWLSSLPLKPLINGNGASLLQRELDFIQCHSSTLLPSTPTLNPSLPSFLHLLLHPSLYHSALAPHPHSSSATVAPFPSARDGDGVKLPGQLLVGWKVQLRLYSKKYNRAFKEGMRGEAKADTAGCGWWG